MIVPRHLAGSALLAVGALSVAPASVAAPSRAPVAHATVSVPYTRFVLPNGLTVLVYSDHTTPSVYVGMTYRIGSRDEPAGRTGFAHLFEHLMFQPTRARPQDFLVALNMLGATDANGMTTQDATRYSEVVPVGALDRVLWLEADRMNNLGGDITQNLLDEQRRIVKNEKAEGDARPGARGGERFFTGFYPAGHPYAHPVIGATADIDAATLADVKGWFQDYYGASNAVLVLAGDIDAAAARDKVTRYFGGVRPGRPIDRAERWVPGFDAVKRELVYEAVPAASIVRTWPMLADDPRRATLMQLAARTIAGARATPLQRALVDEQEVALGLTASVADAALGSTFQLTMTVRPGVAVDRAEKALDEAIARYLADGPEAERLAAVAAASDVAMLRSMESNAAMGNWLSTGEVEHGDPLFFLRQRQWIGATDAAEVKAVAASVIGRPYHQLTAMPTPVLAASPTAPAAMPPVTRQAAAVAFPPVSEQRLANGLKLVVAERHRVPMVDMALRFPVTVQESPTAPAAIELMTAGAGGLDRTALERRMARIGTTVSASAGDEGGLVRWSAPADRIDAATALAAMVVRRPDYPATARSAMRDNVAGHDAGDPTERARAAFALALWGADDPRARITTAAEMPSDAAIRRFHDERLGPDGATLYMVGDITPAAARRLAERHFGSWRRTGAAPPARPVPANPAPVARVILVDAPDTTQSEITVGHRVPAFSADSAAVEAIMDAGLGASFQSRLNAELRGTRGWTYGFTGRIVDAPSGERAFVAGGMVDAAHTADSMAVIREVIAGYAGAQPSTAEEVARDKASMMEVLPTRYARSADVLDALVTADAYRLPYDRANNAGDRIAGVTLDQVREGARRYYRPEALIWVVVGDVARIRPAIDQLGLGPVTVLDR